ncbi:hypothetical protein [Ferruginibacter profundus]
MKKQITYFICSFILLGQSEAQKQVSFPFASKQTRDAVAGNLLTQIKATIVLPVNDSTLRKYTGAFWAMELMLYRPAGYDKKIPGQLLQLPFFQPDFQRAYLEMLYTLYTRQFANEVSRVWEQLANDKVKAMALEYLASNNIFPKTSGLDAFLNTAYGKIYQERWKVKKKAIPSKSAFLDTGFLRGKTVVCSFQSADRNRPGYLMIRNEKSQWVADSNGRPLQFTQLARSISNLPYYISNGNTPQGLYKVTGLDSSDNNWIGPTTNLQMLLPFENGNSVFFETDTAFITHYKKMLGPLAKYSALMESFWAGRLGRSEIIAHGTTIDPAFYSKQQYYPNTPSMGCLCSPELWDVNGERIFSVQMEWINAIKKMDKLPGYLVVAEVKDL